MSTLRFSHILIALLAALLFSGCEKNQDSITPAKAKEVTLSGEEAQQIAKEAYIYGLPMVLNYKTMKSSIISRVWLGYIRQKTKPS